MKTNLLLISLLLLVSCGGKNNGGTPEELPPSVSAPQNFEGVIYRGRSSVNGQLQLQVHFPSDTSKNITLSDFDSQSVVTWDRYAAYVKENESGKSEVFILNLETKSETQLPAVNTDSTTHTPVIHAFAKGILVINSYGNNVLNLGSNRGFLSINVPQALAGSASNWGLFNLLNNEDTDGVVYTNEQGFYGYIENGSGSKKGFYHKVSSAGEISYISMCPDRGSCNRPMTFVGADADKFYYIGTGSDINSPVTLRDWDGEIVANNLQAGYNSITQMITVNGINYYVANDGDNSKVHAVDQVNNTLDVVYPGLENVVEIHTDGTNLYILADGTFEPKALYKDADLLDDNEVSYIASINSRIFYTTNNGSQEFSVADGVVNQMDLHTSKGPLSTFGPIVNGQMYFANVLDNMDTSKNTVGIHNLGTNTTEVLNSEISEVEWVIKFSY